MSDSWLHKGTDILISVTAAALVAVSGKLLADSFNNFRLNQQNAILNNLFLEENTLTRELLTDTRIYSIGWLYGKSLATSAASLEFVPTDSLHLFADIMEGLPSDVEIDRFFFEGQNLHICCTADTEESGKSFVAVLQQSPRVGGTLSSCYENEEGQWVYDILCIHRRKAGETATWMEMLG